MTNPKLAVSTSVVRYLLALDALKGAGGIRTTDVARYLNIKKTERAHDAQQFKRRRDPDEG